MEVRFCHNTVKLVLSGHSKIDKTKVLKRNGIFMKVEGIAECSKGSILQYFRPSLSYHLSLRPLFFLFLSGHLRQVLLYNHLIFSALWLRYEERRLELEVITPNVSEEEMCEVLLADLQQLQGLDGQGVIQMMQNKVRKR